MYLTYEPVFLVDKTGKRIPIIQPHLAFAQEERDIITAIEESQYVVEFMPGVFSKATLDKIPNLHVVHVSGHGMKGVRFFLLTDWYYIRNCWD